MTDASKRRSIKNPAGRPMSAMTRTEITKYRTASARSPRLIAL
jgi:hypothetical protein